MSEPDTSFQTGAIDVPVARYGCRVTEAIRIGRITALVRWVARTPWPVFLLGMLQADIIGALLVFGFLRFGLPPEDRVQLPRVYDAWHTVKAFSANDATLDVLANE